jgi:hypothetical protein
VADADARRDGLVALAREVVGKQGAGGRAALLDAGVVPEIVTQSKEDVLYSYSTRLASIELLDGLKDRQTHWEIAALSEARLQERTAVASWIDAMSAYERAFRTQADVDLNGSLDLVWDSGSPVQPQNLGPHPPGFASQNCSSCHGAP